MLALLATVAGPAASILAAALVLMLIAELACRLEDARNVHWEAIIDWEGDRYTHAGKTRQEALEWAACYPAAAAVRVHEVLHGARTLVAARWSAC